MLNVLLVYFSGTGITRYYTNLIAEEMSNRGHHCHCLDLEEITDLPMLWQKKPVALNYTIRAEQKRPLSKYPWPYQDLGQALRQARANPVLQHLAREWQEYDLIGFGSPVYGFRPAPVMIRLLLDLPLLKSKMRVFSYATHDGAQGDYASFMRRLFTLKDLHYLGHLDQTFVHSASAVMRPTYDYLQAGHLLVRKSFQARRAVLSFIEYIDSMFEGYSGYFKDLNLLGMLAGVPYRFFYSYGIDFVLNHFLFGYGIHREDCIQCMACVNQCPQGLIELDGDGYPLRLYHCMYCLRCLNWCPTDALYFSPATNGKARFPGPEVLLEAVKQQSISRRLSSRQ